MWVVLHARAIGAAVLSPSWHRWLALLGVESQHKPFPRDAGGPGSAAPDDDPGLGQYLALELVKVRPEGISVLNLHLKACHNIW